MNLVINHNITTRDTALGNGGIYIPEKGYLKIASGKIFDMTTPLAGYHNLIVQDSSLLWLDANSQLIVGSGNRLTLKNKGTIKLGYGSEIRFKAGSVFCNEGGRINSHETSSTSWGRIAFDSGYHQVNCEQIADFVFSDSSKLILEEYSTLEFPDSTTLHFTGNQTSLIMKPNSKLKLGAGSKILFDSGANISATNAQFLSSDSSNVWDGITFSNSGADTIIGCTFTNAKTSLAFSYSNLMNNPVKFIRKNIFNINHAYGRGIDARSISQLLIDSNTFNMNNSDNTVGIFFRNATNPADTSGGVWDYHINIVNNKFYDGYLPILISCLTTNRVPVYIYNNQFTGDNSYSIAGIKISGIIKRNIFDDDTYRAIGLWNSNPYIFKNQFKSVSTNMYLDYSFPSIAPIVNGSGNLVWTGGQNTFNSTENENIYFQSSLPLLYRGKNNFTIDEASHLFGSLPDTINLYSLDYNCWSGFNNIPNYILFKSINDTLQTILAKFSPTHCNSISFISHSVTDKGFGIYDTTSVSNNLSTPFLPDDEMIHSQGYSEYYNEHYPNAINSFKGLINNFINSEYIYSSLYELYDCYTALDTTEDEDIRDVLYGDLRQFLQSEINSEDYDNDFESIAYDIILICETMMENYEVALTGYEFLALYHPDAEQRLIASWDYEEIEEMIGGSGGGQLQVSHLHKNNQDSRNIGQASDEFQVEELRELKELKRLNKIIDDDPLMKRMKENFDKANVYVKADKSDTRVQISKQDAIETEKINLRARENIFQSKFLNKNEKEKRLMEDLAMIMNKGSADARLNENALSPLEFRLNQNYPNPFNPVTKITFSIPKQGFVALKIYDVLGKEVMTLVNEQKIPGNYEVEFNGSSLSSGVYFYRIESGDFKEIKRMMLIK